MVKDRASIKQNKKICLQKYSFQSDFLKYRKPNLYFSAKTNVLFLLYFDLKTEYLEYVMIVAIISKQRRWLFSCNRRMTIVNI